MLRLASILLTGALTAAAALPQEKAELSVIRVEQVAQALQAHGLSVSPNQVGFMSRIPSTKPNPDLEVVSAEHWEGNRTTVRVRCSHVGDCLPFFVFVTWPSTSAMENAMLHWTKATPAQRAAAPPSREAATIHAGEHAVLMIEARRLQINLPVICLTNAAVGQIIRVVSPDYKKVYEAQVVGPKLLRQGMREQQ